MDTSFFAVFRNVCFWAPFCAWLCAQFTKMLCGFYRTGRLDFNYLVSTGGMPSAHSAMVCGLATAVGLTMGFGSAAFALALGFALLVMFDASTVRRAAGLQARLLNQILDELFKEHPMFDQRLRELIGHTRLEVIAGAALGILIAYLLV